MADAIWGRILAAGRRGGPERRSAPHVFFDAVSALRLGLALLLLMLLGLGAYAELRTSFLQSWIFSSLARQMTYSLAPGASSDIRFPKSGPYDERLGYTALPGYIESLSAHHFTVTRQARWSPALRDFVDEGGYAIYPEKPRAGLTLFGRDSTPLYRARFPARAFSGFRDVPPLIVRSLLFIEDRYLLDPDDPLRDPAIQWNRFMLAFAGRIGGIFDRRLRQGGASTLATQIEKFEHSPGGRTGGAGEKLRQMLTAAMRAYRTGPNTLEARRHIMAAYLNAEPFGSWPGYGEVTGVPDALYIWYGTSFREAQRVLREKAQTRAELTRQGRIYREALSLLLAGRRPAYYLNVNRPALEALTDHYLELLAASGVIGQPLYNAARHARLEFRRALPPAPPASFVWNKASDWLRDELVSLLHAGNYYNLDHLDLTAYSTIDAAAQQRVTDVLARLADPAYDRSLGLYGKQLLGPASPARITWSFVLYEKGDNANFVRVHADSLNQPFDINSGAKLQLGSTAKLRTLVTYLDIVDELYHRLSGLPRSELLATAAKAPDALTKWAAGYLANRRDAPLQPMLDAAMQRTYSASPAAFFTDGGVEVYANFAKWENEATPSVLSAFQYSINNAFIRIMRDIVNYYIAQGGDEAHRLLTDPDDPERLVYLKRFADAESQVFMGRFYKEYAGLTPDEALAKLARHTGPSLKRLAVVFRSVKPNARIAEMRAFIARHMPHGAIEDDALWDAYRQASVHLFSLEDRAYIAGVHPLALWLVAYLEAHPHASRADVMQASAGVREEAYGWLFNAKNPQKQTFRIRELLEEKAFGRVLQDWRWQGYPFNHLIPSYATAIGSSGDRPRALADLMGVIMNDGVRVPTTDLRRLDFAAGTPYQIDLQAQPGRQRVLSREVAQTVRKALSTVVSGGTAVAVRGVYHAANGAPLAVGGKTGTGDNRFDTWGPGRRLIAQRIVDRTATFVFYLGDRFFGTITAYVPGAVAGQYHFSSALAVHVMRALEPALAPLIDGPREGAALRTASRGPALAAPRPVAY
ncbi:MAG TPA: transglycosylase domain-containing protein [Stellaceae bacterium]|nr:transglycosylase domain-containing protein [Stellaceae bacterium]